MPTSEFDSVNVSSRRWVFVQWKRFFFGWMFIDEDDVVANERDNIRVLSYPEVLALWSLLLALVIPPVGIILSHIALHHIRAQKLPNQWLAATAMIVSYVLTVFVAVGVVAFLVESLS